MPTSFFSKFKKHYRQGNLRNVLYNIACRPFKMVPEFIPVVMRDLGNITRYGLSAPRYMERIWVNPKEIEWFIPRDEITRITGMHRYQACGLVINWEDVNDLLPLYDQYRIQYCLKHWKEGLSWEELGVYDHMSKTRKYGELPRGEIIQRFELLDRAYEETKRLGRLKTRQELDPSNFREEEGILVHIGRDGKPFFGGNGYHRLSIALALGLETIPACIGVVDREAIRYLHKFRRSPL